MILMVSGAAKRGYQCVGDFTSPARRQLIGQTPIWAADNGCFNALDESRFLHMLDKIAAAIALGNSPVFVTVPDVVGNHAATCDRWIKWSREFDARSIPQAFVLQNGIEQHPPEHALPWARVRAIFIGGTTEFKFSPWVRAACRLARRAGHKWIHMGRVNSVRRLRYARDIGCHSCDGSGMSRFPDAMLPRMQNALLQLELLPQYQPC